MQQLISNYSIGEIFTFLIILAIAIKEGISIYDVIANKIKDVFKKKMDERKGEEEVAEAIDTVSEQVDNWSETFRQKEDNFNAKKIEIENKFGSIEKSLSDLEQHHEDDKKGIVRQIVILGESQQQLIETMHALKDNVQLLIESDRDAIKSYIVDKHHYFCYQQKWIDDYNMDCLEKRYSHYLAEHGNSYVEELMSDLRALPKTHLAEKPVE